MPYTYPNRQNLLNRSSFYDIDNANIGSLIVNDELISKGDTHLNIIKPVNTNIIIDSDLDISGNIQCDNLEASGNIQCLNIDVSGTLSTNNLLIYNDIDISGDLTVEGKTYLNQDLAVLGNSKLNNVDISGYLAVLGNSGFNNVDISGYLSVLGNSEFNNVDISNNLIVHNDISIYADLDVSGQIHTPYLYTQTLNMTGGSLAILPNTTLAQDISANNLYIANQEIINKSIIQDLSANISHFNNSIIQDLSANNVRISGNANFYNVLCHDISANEIDAIGDIVSSGTVVGNAFYTANNVQALGNINGGNLYSSGYIIGSYLDISGISKFHNNVDISGILNVKNTLKCIDISANNILLNDVSGVIGNFTTLNAGTINATTFNLGADIDISGKLEISNSISGLTLPTTTIEMIKNSNINIFGQNVSSSPAYGWNIGMADKLYFAKYDAGGFRDYLTIDASGKIGINNTAPSKLLQIDCSGYNDEFMVRRYANTPGSYNAIYTESTAGTTTILNIVGGGSVSGQPRLSMATFYGRAYPSLTIAGINDGGGSSHMVFYTAPIGLSTNVSERLRITNAGLVGINQSSPTELLHLYNGNLRLENSTAQYNESQTDHALIIDYNRANSGTRYGGMLIRKNTSERYAGVVWDDLNAMTINRYNPYYSKYFNNTCAHISGRYEHNGSLWGLGYSRFTNNPANYNNPGSLFRSFYQWDSPTTYTTIITNSSSPSLLKYYVCQWSGFIDNTSFTFDYELRYNDINTGIETVICYTSQQYGQKGCSMSGICPLKNGDEVRLYVRVLAVSPQGGYGYFNMTISEIY